MPNTRNALGTLRYRNSSCSALGQITLAGFLRHTRGIPRTTPMRILGHYALVYLVDGAGSYEDANGLRQGVAAGDVIFLFPTLGHYYGPGPGQDWTEIFLVFNGPVFDLWQSTGLLTPRRPILHAEPVAHWLARIESILASTRKAGLGPALLEVCRLQQVLAELLTLANEGNPTSADRVWADRICALLASDENQTLDLRSLATRNHTSYHSFRKRFTRIIGTPPARYRNLRIMDRACEMIQSGEFTGKQIAATLGFVDESHFSRRFKQVTGTSPRQFRARLPLHQA